ncbi:MAG: hypothetical protein KBT31_00700, partial [Firmicutes bacterium]|nr:hypothetical protein [Candidatus Colimorpha enterica]
MIFGKHINKYYLKYSPILLLGILCLVAVDWAQLEIPELYRLVVNGLNGGTVLYKGETIPFDIPFLLSEICVPLIIIICCLIVGRFLWRICFFGTAILVETDLRKRMFDKCKDLSQQFYEENKVGTLMSLFTNDLETVQDCFGSGILCLCDALFLGCLAMIKMFNMNKLLALLSMIPMALLLSISIAVGKTLAAKWDKRQQAFSNLSDFSQENFSGITVIKAFVKEVIELCNFKKLNVENEKAIIDDVKAATLFNITVSFFAESVICVILGYGGYLVYKGTFDAGQLVEFIGYFTAVIWP